MLKRLQLNPSSVFVKYVCVHVCVFAAVEDTKFEENLLALSSTQCQWSLDIGFVLHEATMLPKCLQNAGFLFHGRLGQYIASQAAPGCLRWTRLQLLGFQPLPERTATVWVFAR